MTGEMVSSSWQFNWHCPASFFSSFSVGSGLPDEETQPESKETYMYVCSQ